MVLTGESVEYLRNGTDRGKCGLFTQWYRQGIVWSVYGMVLTGESVECLRNGIDRGKYGVFTEWY